MLIAKKMLMETLTPQHTADLSENDLNKFLEELIPLIQNKRYTYIKYNLFFLLLIYLFILFSNLKVLLHMRKNQVEQLLGMAMIIFYS